MPRDPRYDILFEPVKIGPKTAKNRFYQVPHCTGMGSGYPHTLAAMRGMKAAGGWAVVNTEYCSIHPSSDDTPFAHCRLWNDDDIRDLALMTEAVHAHGALAGVELWHGGRVTLNRYSRQGLLAPRELASAFVEPVQARRMDKQDIRNLRRWQSDAAKRAVIAGFDIVYVYCGHAYLPMQFLSPLTNDRSDEYGGSLENRARLLRELIEETRAAVGDKAAVAVRLNVGALVGLSDPGADREVRAVIEMLGELPDLWDLQLGDYHVDARSSRFVKEAAQEPYVAFVKRITSKPVVGVGRFTSPDTMVSQIKRGILDFIGAARPSIADPFLPKKIEEGRPEDIRECIGCNVCIASDYYGVPLRCTQNPTMGEEWRRGWHPEIIAPKASSETVLIVGAGPAGLECARALGQRGYEVHLAEATTELGGRVTLESRLPGLSEWARVRDYRVGQIEKMANVTIYRDSRMGATEIRESGFAHVVLATGSRWCRDGQGRSSFAPIPGAGQPQVFTPDDVLAGRDIPGPILVYDDDPYYMGGAVAEELRKRGQTVSLVTPAALVSEWTVGSQEQPYIQARLIEAGVDIIVSHRLAKISDGEAQLVCVFTERPRTVTSRSVVLVTLRTPDDALYHELMADDAALADAGIKSVTRIGDCLVPGTIAAAVYDGHRYAREFGAPPPHEVPFERERIAHAPPSNVAPSAVEACGLREAQHGAAPDAPQTAIAASPDQPTLQQVIKHANTRLTNVLDPALAAAMGDWATRFDALPKRDLRDGINIVVFHVDVDPAQHVAVAYRDVSFDHRAFDYTRIVDHFIRMSTAFNAEARVILVTSEDSRMSFTHDRLTTIRLPIDSAGLMFERAKAMCAYVRSTAFDRDSVFLDSDAFPNRSLKEVFSGPFDIGVTHREHDSLMPINEGAIYVAHRNLEAVQNLFRTYLATYAALIDDPVVRSYYGNIRPWRGGQLALNALCHREPTIELSERTQTCGALVQFLPCDTYNFWILLGSRHTTSELDSKYVLHLKGLSKRLLNPIGRYQMAQLAARRVPK